MHASDLVSIPGNTYVSKLYEDVSLNIELGVNPACHSKTQNLKKKIAWRELLQCALTTKSENREQGGYIVSNIVKKKKKEWVKQMHS